MGGRFFDTEKPTQLSTLSKQQEQLLLGLIDYIKPLYDSEQPGMEELTQRLLGSTTDESKALSERIFKEALLGPAVETFERSIKPTISGDFASIGGTLSSRRTRALAEAGEGVVRGATSSFASILPQVQAFPLQQTLGQIQGLGELQRQRFLPYQQALQAALTPTQNATRTAPGPGWEIVSEAIKAAGVAAAACWIAGRLYGEGSTRQQVARWWIFGVWRGPLARTVQRLYLRYGERLSKCGWACELLRPLFDLAVRAGLRRLANE